jgi:hypothetical protein
MVVYEVNLDVDAEIAEPFAIWLEEHVREMLTLDGFVGAEWLARDPDRSDGSKVSWTVWYRLIDRQALESYLARHAERMRADGLKRFPGRFSASRRVLCRPPGGILGGAASGAAG